MQITPISGLSCVDYLLFELYELHEFFFFSAFNDLEPVLSLKDILFS